MRYYVASDIHGFFGCFIKALEEKGYFSDRDEHKLIILGDLFDRGMEARELQEFILEQMIARQITEGPTSDASSGISMKILIWNRPVS